MAKRQIDGEVWNLLEELGRRDWSDMPEAVETQWGRFECEYITLDDDRTFVQLGGFALPDGWFAVLEDLDTWSGLGALMLEVENAPWRDG